MRQQRLERLHTTLVPGAHVALAIAGLLRVVGLADRLGTTTVQA